MSKVLDGMGQGDETAAKRSSVFNFSSLIDTFSYDTMDTPETLNALIISVDR
jgi:hypothetical protein